MRYAKKIDVRHGLTKIFCMILLAGIVLGVSGCSDEVSEDQAKKAGEILKEWQDQNK